MKRLFLAAAAILAAETAAFACSCIATDDPAELKRFAVESARDAIALVEVEALSGYDHSTGTSELMRVTRTHAGSAPAQFRVHRTNFPSSASCDIEYRAGQRDLVILYPAPAAGGEIPTLRTSGLCTDHLLDKPLFREELMRRIGPVPGSGERG